MCANKETPLKGDTSREVGVAVYTCRWVPALLCFLDEQGKKLCLHKLLDKSALGLGGDGLTEGSFLEVALPTGLPFDIGRIVAHSLDKELHKRA